jgi:formylmethanofuran dehydrogenase subunit E
MYEVQPHPDKMRWSVLDEKGREYGTYNSKKVAEKEKRRLNKEPEEPVSEIKTCFRFDEVLPGEFLPCSLCGHPIADGEFYYRPGTEGRIVCAPCAEGGESNA